MQDLAVKRQQAWDSFIQKRTKTEAQYNELISKESKSPYQPLRQYVEALPKTLQEVIPSFYIPMEEALEFPEQAEVEIAKYNEIVETVNNFMEEMLRKAEEECAAFDANVQR